MLKGDSARGNITCWKGHDELVTAKELFATHLKVDERTKQIYKNFNVKEYVIEVMQNKGKEKCEEETCEKVNDNNEDKNGRCVGGNEDGKEIERMSKTNNRNISNGEDNEDNANEADNEHSGGDTDSEYRRGDEHAYKEELQFLKSNPLDLNRWHEFLEIYEREEAYELFLLIFPRCTLYWTKYAELKIKKKEYNEAYKIYRKCIDANIYDLKLFFSFLYFTYHTSSIHEYISFLFEGLKYVGTDIKSGSIWVELLYILIKIHNTNLILNNDIQNLLYDPFKNINNRNRNEEGPLLPSENEQMIFSSPIPNKTSKSILYTEHYTNDGKLRKFYHCWINNPTKYLDKVWKCFCSYEKSITDNFTNSSLAAYNTQYLNSKNAYRELYILYKELNRDRKSKICKKCKLIIPINRKYKIENYVLLGKWMKIINFEKSNSLKLSLPLVRKRIMYVYEQALIHLQFNADLWFSYFQFLLLNKKHNYAIRIMREAIEIYLPFDELLKLNFAYFFEKHALLNQAHFIYQLMLNEVTKKRKKFSLLFLHSKKMFKKGFYGFMRKKTRRRKVKRKISEKDQIHRTDAAADNIDEKKDTDQSYTRSDGEGKKGCKKIKAVRTSPEKTNTAGINSSSEIEHEHGKDKNSGSYSNVEETDQMQNAKNKGNDDLSPCEDNFKKKFHQCEYEKIDERKKYFIKYINLNKRKRRDFVFVHFLNFVKRNYDETIWRYYTGIILNEKKCSQYIYYYCANMERRILKNEKRALYIMNEGYKKYGSKKGFLLFYIKFLIEKGNICEIRSLIYKFIHNFYAKFYKEYDKEHSCSSRKNVKVKLGQNEFNQFDSNYLKLLKKKKKTCSKYWTLLMQLEILYGDINNLNKIWETKLKYESGYNLEENKNILIDFDNISNNYEHISLDDSTLTDILSKGCLENLKKNDIDNLQFKINLLNSQLFGGMSLKKTFTFFQVSSTNVFEELLSLNDCVTKIKKKERKKKTERQEQHQGEKKKKKKNAMEVEEEDEDEEEKNQRVRFLNEHANKEHLNESDISENRMNKRNPCQSNFNEKRGEEGGGGIDNNEFEIVNLRKQKRRFIKKGTMKSTYDSFNFLDSGKSVKKKKEKNISSSMKNGENKIEDKTVVTGDTVTYISRPNLKKMILYKPLENYEHSEIDGGKIPDKKNISMSEYPYCVNDMNKNDDRNYFFKREYFTMPNIINDFLSLLPEENSNLNVSDNSIDYLITSLQKLTIPKLKKFPYEPIPVKDIIQIKSELNS
ncbi:hypothetical protein, conserved [Plasmodium gonderi]|uniref:Suppressor of forked domain-containing protein n=1 Tax=Plasmodium gonderi TaxID=77519 RepID=A0A1Y1JKH0_PLAGO|nr:hypothetical protein, conserved [Plasmodium gonderi]GAW81292.1 hypothetical protein, conserved [Plasmodium gonderi]